MESILARALEYTLKYWLKSFTRDQFKLQGRTVQLSNLDVNGDALHASLGLPPALNVTTAKVGKLEIILPSVSMVQIEPIVVQIDRLDLVLEENDDVDASSNFNSAASSASIGKGSGYGFADKIADGMTIQVHTVNLLLETHGGARQRGGATWASPMGSITMRNLMLYTTNESWEVVNLKEARDFSSDQKFIYVFKKLEWEHLSFDLLPHPDMFTEANFSKFQEGSNRKDEDGAKRVFFGGERFLEGVSGEAYITIQRTELNAPLGLEVQLHITEALCPSLSEPGLRALLRFFTGFYVCLNRGDVNPTAQQGSAEAAGRSLVSVAVDHIFLCIKDADFRLELLMQSLLFSRASVSDGENAKNLTRVMIGGLFLRDTHSPPPCTLVQPSMQTASDDDTSQVPEFCKNFCPQIYPLGDQHWQWNCSAPLISLHCLQLLPSPIPPTFASRTVVDCRPLMIHLQEESCLRISSFLVDGVIVSSGAVLPDSSINSLVLNLRGLDVTVPLEIEKLDSSRNCNMPHQSSFSGAKLHIEDLTLSQSPSLRLSLLNLEKDPACFCLWETQPVDASQKKLSAEASLLSLSLETSTNLDVNESSPLESVLWKCVEIKDSCVEVAMVTADGSPLTTIPPPGGVVRVAVACQQYFSNTSVEQLFFVLDVYAYFGGISEKITVLGKNKTRREVANEPAGGNMMEKVPADTAVNLAVKNLLLRFLESSSNHSHETPLVCFVGDDLSIKVSHRTFGGAMAISSNIRWERVVVDCADALGDFGHEKGSDSTLTENDHKLRTVFWVQNCRAPNDKTSIVPFLDVSIAHMIPYSVQDIELHSLNVSACIAGVRLGGGMNYAEYLLHRFGILGRDGGPGDGLTRGVKHLTDGPLSKIFKGSSLIIDGIENGSSEASKDNSLSRMGAPDDVEISIELKDWLFSLESAEEMTDRISFYNSKDYDREERSWHTTFRCLHAKSKSNPKHENRVGGMKVRRKQKYPIELITLGMEGLQILKPLARKNQLCNGLENGLPTCIVNKHGGVNVEIDIVASEDDDDDAVVNWVVENFKFSVKDPMEAEVRKDELQHLAVLCRSEVESLGRIAAGILRILKLEGSVGPAAINQLSNLGSESFDRIFTSDKSSATTLMGLSDVTAASVECTVASLEEAILDSKAKCAVLLATEMQSSSKYIDDFKQLNEKLESMQQLLDRLRTQL